MKTYKTKEAEKQTGVLEQLLQCTQIVWDGDLISKAHRNWLVDADLVVKMPGGFNIVTSKGLQYLIDLKLIAP